MLRVAVIGAGLAGLTAAHRLAKADVDVSVFEARDRVGGRVWSDSISVGGRSIRIERGAEFILDGYEAARALLSEHRLELIDTGMSYYVRVPGDAPTVSTGDIVRAGGRAFDLARRLGGTLSAEDVISRSDTRDEVVRALRARIEISTAVGSAEVSADSLATIASFDPRPSWRIAGGNQRLPEALAASIGNVIRFGTVVTQVGNLPDGGAMVTTASGGTEVFDAVVVALPLALVRDPAQITLPFSAARNANLDRVTQGHAAKLHLPLGSNPASSAVMSVEGRYWTWTARDTSGDVPPVMNAFMGSLAAITKAGIATEPSRWVQRVRTLRHDLDIALDAAAVVTNWSQDPFAGGAYAAHAPADPGMPPIDLESPIGDVYWAGEYAEREFTGLMEGAVRSGERAARRVLQRRARGRSAEAAEKSWA